jgi:hypothetical protein
VGQQQPARRDIRRPGGRSGQPRRRDQSPISGARAAIGAALGVASPPAIIAVIALIGALINLPGPVTGLPLGLLFIVVVQLAGLLVGRESELWSWFRVWLILAAATIALLPTAAIQSASARVPFTTLTNGSAGLLITSSLGVIIVLLGLLVLAAVLAADMPENASILLTPALLLVPAVLGAPGRLDEQSAMLALGEAFAVSAVAIAVGWLLPRNARPLVGLVALGAQFGVLWAVGFGPVTAPGRGAIVPVMSIMVLAATVLVAAMVPIAALIAHRFAQTVRNLPPDRKQPRSEPASRSDSSPPGGRSRSRLSVPPRGR